MNITNALIKQPLTTFGRKKKKKKEEANGYEKEHNYSSTLTPFTE